MALPSPPAFLAVDSAQLGCLPVISSPCSPAFQTRVLFSTHLNILAQGEILVIGRRRLSCLQSIAVCLCKGAAGSPPALLREATALDADGGSCDYPISKAHDEVDVIETTKIGERERRRRERIGLANKGKMPWNKGKKHSPATIALIKERNREVMRDPKIREKLRQYSHPQSEETREKLRIFMKARMEFERRQLSCVQEWKESIAETARVGGVGDEELLWDSYKILKQDLKREHLSATKERKKSQKVDTSRSWTMEQRLKISESVRAKWEEDPTYRQKVSMGMSEFHRRQDRRKSKYGISLDGEIETYSTFANSEDFTSTSSDRDSKSPILIQSGSSDSLPTAMGSFGQTMESYYDPLVKEKLQRVKQLRARNIQNREQLLQKKTRCGKHGGSGTAPREVAKEALAVIDAVELAQHAATERARILLAEAERAAIVAQKALEAAGSRDNVEFSLRKARTLLDEANRSLIRVGAGTSSP